MTVTAMWAICQYAKTIAYSNWMKILKVIKTIITNFQLFFTFNNATANFYGFTLIIASVNRLLLYGRFCIRVLHIVWFENLNGFYFEKGWLCFEIEYLLDLLVFRILLLNTVYTFIGCYQILLPFTDEVFWVCTTHIYPYIFMHMAWQSLCFWVVTIISGILLPIIKFPRHKNFINHFL